MKKFLSSPILKDIRFWLMLFFVIRLIGVTNPPLEIAHNWRQTHTNMMTRNFIQGDANIFYPQIDHAGERSGIIGSEFPFFNYLQYLLSFLFGYAHWHGRLINLIVSTIGLFYFFKLSSVLFNKQIAFKSTIILSLSIWFIYSRKIMPDTFSIALMFIGLYQGYLYLFKKANPSKLLFYFILVTLGMLCKIPSLYLLSMLCFVPFLKNIPQQKKWWILLFSGLSTLIVYWWYFIWAQDLVRLHKFQLFFPKGFLEGFLEILPLKGLYFEKFYFSALHSYVALVFVIIGVYYFIRTQDKSRLLLIGTLTLSFTLFTFKTGSVFPLHSYYVIPFVPIIATLAAFGVSKLPSKYHTTFLLFIAIEAVANQQHDFFIKENRIYKLGLEEICDQYIAKEDLIVINGGQSSTDIYFTNRKGWTIHNHQINPNYLDSLGRLGAEYLIIDKASKPIELKDYPDIYEDSHYQIYKLSKE